MNNHHTDKLEWWELMPGFFYEEHDYKGHCSACDQDYWTGDYYGILVLCPECYEDTPLIPMGRGASRWPRWMLIEYGYETYEG